MGFGGAGGLLAAFVAEQGVDLMDLAKRQAAKEGLDFESLDNGFASCAREGASRASAHACRACIPCACREPKGADNWDGM